MPRAKPLLVVMLLAAVLAALPASAAFAQSAGDNQYQDPIPGSSGSSGGSKKPSTPSQPAPSSGSAGSSASAAPARSHRATRSVPLARTGFDARIPLVAGLLLFAGGLLLLRTRRSSA